MKSNFFFVEEEKEKGGKGRKGEEKQEILILSQGELKSYAGKKKPLVPRFF